MNPTLRQLQAFVYVYHLGSLTKAADRMFVTQAAVSVLIKQLEEILGVRLFDRTSRSLKPTLAALETLPTAERMLRDLEDLKTSARGLAERTHGQLRFGVTAAVACTLMPAVVQEFRQQYPGIKLAMQDMSPDRLVTPVVREEIEFSIGTPDEESDEIEVTTLLRDYLSIICRRDSPLAARKTIRWTDIKSFDTLTVRPGNRIRALVDEAVAQAGDAFEPTYEVSFLSTALALTAQGLAVAVLPSYLVESYQYTDLVARKLTQPVVARNLYLVAKRGRSLSPAATGFVELLKKSIAAKSGSERHGIVAKNPAQQ